VARETGRIVWHELLTPDVETAQRFYRDLLGWDVELSKPEEGDYPMIRWQGSPHGGFQRTHPDSRIPPHWLPHVEVDDVDAVVSRVRELGGTVRAEPFDVRDVGRLAILQDREGAEFAAVARTVSRARPEGVFLWDELLVDDSEGARQFYGRVLGWRDEDAGEGYAVLYAGDHAVAGVTRRPVEVSRPTWLTYVATADVDASITRVGELGGSVLTGVTESEGVGRWATFTSPPGAAAGLLQPAPA
jgi:predicted enzyme related to lactoylglutathione lyase